MRFLIFLLLLTQMVYAQTEIKGESAFTEGMKYFLLENYTQALPHFESFVKIDDKSAVGYFMKSRTEASMGNLLQAEFSGKRAVELESKNPFYIEHLANVLTISNKNLDAQKVYQDYLKVFPQKEKAYFDLINLQVAAGQKNEAIKTLEKAEKTLGLIPQIVIKKQELLIENNKISDALKEGSKIANSSNEALLKQAELLFQNNKKNDAINILKERIAADVDFTEGYLLLSEFLMKDNKSGELEKLLASMFEMPNLDAKTKSVAFSNLQKIKKPSSELAAQFEKWVDPTDAKGNFALGDLLLSNGNYIGARDAYAKGVSLERNNFEVWEKLLELNFKIADFKKLELDAEKASMYFPNQPSTWFYLGVGQYLNGNYSDLDLSKDELERVKGKKSWVDLLTELNLTKGNKLNKTIESSDLVVTYFNILSEIETDKVKEISVFNSNNTSVVFQLLKIRSLLLKGDLLEAETLIESISADYSVEFWNLKGDISAAKKQTDDAKKYWSRALGINKNDKKIQDKIKKLP